MVERRTCTILTHLANGDVEQCSQSATHSAPYPIGPLEARIYACEHCVGMLAYQNRLGLQFTPLEGS